LLLDLLAVLALTAEDAHRDDAVKHQQRGV
jgi:hypothetical protein